ncbi:MAG: glutamate--cysteine ligase [Burkholderiaceae bacterium]
MVPHLLTALKGPLQDLEQRILDATPQIERWFRLEWQEHTPAFYCSVDLRNAAFKLAPVDTSLFPVGFDHLSAPMLPLAQQAAMAAIEKYCPDARNLLLIPDLGRLDRINGCYGQNILRLAALLRQTGLSVRFGSFDPSITEPTAIDVADGQTLTIEPLVRNGRRLGLRDFDPCTIVLNDDLSEGLPDILQDIYEQTLLPPLHAGWAVRRRSQHLAAYQDVAKKFGKAFDIDPWLINPAFARCGPVDLREPADRARLTAAVETVLKQMRSKYREYGVADVPYAVIKPEAGADGRGMVMVRDLARLPTLIDQLAAKAPERDLVVQEGVPTIETMEGGTAEPIVYMIDRYVIGGYYRVNAERGRDENLIAPGLRFVPLPFATSCNMPDCSAGPEHAQNRFYAYGVVARLAMLASAIELERTDPDQSLYG